VYVRAQRARHPSAKQSATWLVVVILVIEVVALRLVQWKQHLENGLHVVREALPRTSAEEVRPLQKAYTNCAEIFQRKLAASARRTEVVERKVTNATRSADWCLE
jgi:hypothetical protein